MIIWERVLEDIRISAQKEGNYECFQCNNDHKNAVVE